MVFKLFKNGDELYDQSKELIQRGEFKKARDYLVKSIEKDGGTDDVAAVQVALIDLSSALNNSGAYKKVITAINGLSSTRTIEFGLETIDCDALLIECEITSRKLDLTTRGFSTGELVERGKSLHAVAQDYQAKIGDKSLIVPSLFMKNTSLTGNTEFFSLMALGYESMAEGVVFDDPAQAAEYQQIAAGYRQQNGEDASENMRKVTAYARTCTCWVCGRIATGEGVHFYSTRADVSPSLKDDANNVAQSRADTEHIYICRACYSAVSYRADAIAQEYHNRAMQEMRAMEARLQAEIAALEMQIRLARR